MAGDPRFFEYLGPLPLEYLAELTEARLERGKRAPAEVSSVAPLHTAAGDQITYCASARAARNLVKTAAGACFVKPRQLQDCLSGGATALVVDAPEDAFAKAINALYQAREHHDRQGAVSSRSEIHPDARIAFGAVVAPGVRIAADARIGAGAVVGPGVAVGEGTVIEAGVSLGFCTIGRNVRIGANAVIGGIGFGVTGGPDGLVEMSHIGGVTIGDEARIGALTAIDRGRFEDTVIGRSAKIDNHCHIAHNVRIGEGCLIAAFAGISGSSVIGDGAMLGGRVGVSDHLTIGKHARLGADAAVMRDVPDGETWLGSPAKPLRAFFREVATLEKLAGTTGKRQRESET